MLLIGESLNVISTKIGRAYKERDELLIAIKTNPYLDPIRTDERFSELLKKIGLE